ncbi:MAG TPA: GNAT family N-acetyltransferase, partial [Stellaceae bacterium]|nr:GNAT family N-acetyltransferase [Stellaceae bacterium]
MTMPSTAETTATLPKIVPGITTEWRRFDDLTVSTLYELLRLRQQIFVVEQHSAYPDLDGLDKSALHLLLAAEGTLAGCLRLLPPADAASPARIGRVAVAARWRGNGLGRRLMADALSFCRDHHAERAIGLSAQLYLVPFYRSFGFGEIGTPYDDFGVPHIDMRLLP